MIFGILLFLFIIVCVLVCFVILIQSDKGGGISGAIGGLSGANNFLGTQDTATVLTKGTYILGSIFLVLCVLMTFLMPGKGGSIPKSGLEKRAERVQGIAPAVPASAGGMGFADDAQGFAPEAGEVEEAVPAAADGVPAAEAP